jgi:hypothetical protein
MSTHTRTTTGGTAITATATGTGTAQSSPSTGVLAGSHATAALATAGAAPRHGSSRATGVHAGTTTATRAPLAALAAAFATALAAIALLLSPISMFSTLTAPFSPFSLTARAASTSPSSVSPIHGRSDTDPDPAPNQNPFLRELAALNAKRDAYFATLLKSRNASDKQTLADLRRRAGTDIAALELIADAQTQAAANAPLPAAPPQPIANKSVSAAYTTLAKSRATAILAARKTLKREAKPHYERLLKRALDKNDFQAAKEIKAEIDALDKSEIGKIDTNDVANKFIGKYSAKGGVTIQIFSDNTAKLSWQTSKERWRIDGKKLEVFDRRGNVQCNLELKNGFVYSVNKGKYELLKRLPE